MFTVNTFSKLPVWEQITEEIKKYILLGFLKPGDKIPSVREFSLKAGVNPNTVAKSYVELTRLGIISAAGGIGTFVTPDAVEKIKEIAKKRLPEFETSVKDFLRSGITKEELISVIENIEENENEK